MAETITISLETTTQELTLYVDQSARGPAGADGAAGAAGEAGPQGETGPAGSDANVTNANVNAAIEADPAASRTALDLGTGDTPTFADLNLIDGTTTTLNLYNLLSGGNTERLSFRWDTNVARIGTSKTGTGGARDLVIETDGIERMRIAAAGAATMGTSLSVSSTVTAGGGFSATGLGYRCLSGGFIFWDGRSAFFSPSDGVVGVWNSSGTGFERLQLGGKTSSFPAIKRNGTAVNIRLADDSADAPLTCSNLTASGDIEASTTAKGLILKSPDGTRYRVTVANGGALNTTAI